MFFKGSSGRSGKIAGVALAAAITAGCSATMGTAGGYQQGVVDYVPSQVEPQSCKSLRRFDDRLAQQRARGNTRITNSIIGAVVGAVTGNDSSRDAGIGAAGGAVVGEVYTRSQERAARNQLLAQCRADLQALQQPGGACSWSSNTNEGVATRNGRPVGDFEGNARRRIDCEGAGGPGRVYDPGS